MRYILYIKTPRTSRARPRGGKEITFTPDPELQKEFPGPNLSFYQCKGRDEFNRLAGGFADRFDHLRKVIPAVLPGGDDEDPGAFDDALREARHARQKSEALEAVVRELAAKLQPLTEER